MGTGRNLRALQADLYRWLRCGIALPDPTQTYVGLLRSGLTLGESSTLADLIAGECHDAAYTSRAVLGQLMTSADATGNTLTFPEHARTADQPCFLISTGSPPAPLAEGTQYFIRNPTTNTIQVAASAGGAAIDLTTTGSGSTYLIMGSAFDTTDKREESIYNEATVSVSGADVIHQGFFWAFGARATPSITVAGINTTSEEITTSAAHGGTTADPVMITADSGGTQPGGSSGTTIYYMRSTGSALLTLHPTAADASANTNILNLSSAGASVRIRFVPKFSGGFEYYSTAETIPNGQSKRIQVFDYFSNQGVNVGV